MKKYIAAAIVVFLCGVPFIVSAQISTASTSTSGTVYLINPLGETDPRVLAGRLIAGLLSVIGTITLLMFVYAGVLWITAQGEPKKVQRGKDIMVWATLGLGVIAGAYVLVNALVKAFTTGSAV